MLYLLFFRRLLHFGWPWVWQFRIFCDIDQIHIVNGCKKPKWDSRKSSAISGYLEGENISHRDAWHTLGDRRIPVIRPFELIVGFHMWAPLGV